MIIAQGKKCEAAGFTLLELLVAITLTAILIVTLHVGFRVGTRAADFVERSNERTQQIALVYDFLQSELSAPVPLTSGDDGADNAINFVGEAHGLSFATLPPVYLALGGFHSLRLSLEPTPDGSNRLVVSWAVIPREPEVTGAQTVQPSILMNGVRNVTFGYLGPSGDKAAAWFQSWKDQKSLPWLIRLRIQLDDGTSAPELIVQPRLGNPVQP